VSPPCAEAESRENLSRLVVEVRRINTNLPSTPVRDPKRVLALIARLTLI
jgi:hypothetical protein